MPAHPTFKGYLQFSLVTIPVQAYTAAESDGGDIRLNQLHKDCGERIKHVKTCPTHGPVRPDEIISGYQFAKDEYVPIEPAELDKVRRKRDKTITLQAFIDSDAIDVRYYSGRTLYLLPDGAIARKPYALVHRLLTDEKKIGFATAIMSHREQIMTLRPMGDRLLGASILNYPEEVRNPSAYDGEITDAEVDAKELKLAKMVVEQLTEKDFDLNKFHDPYDADLKQLIEQKVKGREIIAQPEVETPHVTDLMDALRRSLAGDSGGGRAARPTRRPAATARKRAATYRRAA